MFLFTLGYFIMYCNECLTSSHLACVAEFEAQSLDD